MPIISVIIPVYNVEQYLNQCIDSVLNQGVEDIEIILVNDGSTDNSGNICDEYAKKDSRIIVIRKENGGLSDARNYGINKAKGKYILFLDSDDFWMENSLKEIYEISKEENDIVFLTATKLFEKSNKIQASFESLEKDKIKGKSKEDVFDYLAKSDKFPVSACTKLIKRDLIKNNNLFFEKGLLSEDIDWSTRLLLKSEKFDVCDVDFYVYRKQRDNSITDSIKLKNVSDLFYIIKKWYIKCNNNELNTKLVNNLLALYSYEYTILMGHLYTIEKQERKQLIKEIKTIKDILKYSKSKKIKLIKNLSKIIGFNNTCRLLNLYIRSKG